MCLNALVFNKPADEYWTEARNFYQRGKDMFDSQERKSHTTAYGAEIFQIFEANSLQLKTTLPEVPVSDKGAIVDPFPKFSKAKKLKRQKLQDLASDEYPQSMAIEEPNTNLETVDEKELGQTGEIKINSTGDISCSLVIEGKENNIEKDVNVGADNLGASVTASESKPDRPQAVSAEEEKSSDCTYILPDALVEAPDPGSFISNPLIVQSIEEAFFSMALDVCSICSSAGSSGFLLFCTGFYAVVTFHSLLIKITI